MLASARRALSEAETLPEISEIVDRAEVIRVAARKAGLGLDAQNDWAEFKLDAERRAGEMLAGMELSGNRYSGNKLLPLGIEKVQSHRWQKLAGIDETAYEDWKAERRNKDEEITEAGALRIANRRVTENTGEPEWYTPEKYLVSVRAVFEGDIELDPATSTAAQEIVRAERFYTVEDDGLVQDWRGRIFLNPPYAASLVSQFTRKLVEHHKQGAVPEAVLLVNNATDTRPGSTRQRTLVPLSASPEGESASTAWHTARSSKTPTPSKARRFSTSERM